MDFLKTKKKLIGWKFVFDQSGARQYFENFSLVFFQQTITFLNEKKNYFERYVYQYF
jgi:hypothetical protein